MTIEEIASQQVEQRGGLELGIRRLAYTMKVKLHAANHWQRALDEGNLGEVGVEQAEQWIVDHRSYVGHIRQALALLGVAPDTIQDIQDEVKQELSEAFAEGGQHAIAKDFQVEAESIRLAEKRAKYS